MIVNAKYMNARISEQKVQPILKKIRGLSLEKAVDILTFSNKKASFFVKKVLRSVIANAEHNNGLDIDQLFIYRIYVCSGSSLKRFKIRAKGRSNRMLRKNCHIFVEVKERQ